MLLLQAVTRPTIIHGYANVINTATTPRAIPASHTRSSFTSAKYHAVCVLSCIMIPSIDQIPFFKISVCRFAVDLFLCLDTVVNVGRNTQKLSSAWVPQKFSPGVLGPIKNLLSSCQNWILRHCRLPICRLLTCIAICDYMFFLKFICLLFYWTLE